MNSMTRWVMAASGVLLLVLPGPLHGQDSARPALDSLRLRIEEVSRRQMEAVRRIQEASQAEIQLLRQAVEAERGRIGEVERALVEAERALETERIRTLTTEGVANQRALSEQIRSLEVELARAQTVRDISSADPARSWEPYQPTPGVEFAPYASTSEALAGLVAGLSSRIDQDSLVQGQVEVAGRVASPYYINSSALTLTALAGIENMLGVKMVSLNDGLATYFGVGEGSLILEVSEDSPADRGGLRPGDVIVEVGGTVISDPGDVRNAIRERQLQVSADAVEAAAPRGIGAEQPEAEANLRQSILRGLQGSTVVNDRLTFPLPLRLIREGEGVDVTLEP